MKSKVERSDSGSTVAVCRRVEGGWQVLTGRVDGGRAAVYRVERLRDVRPAVSDVDRCVLLVRSRRTVCRLVSLPRADDDELARMVATHLEAELPYPAEEALWSWQKPSGAGRDVRTVQALCLAVPRAEVDPDRAELRRWAPGGVTVLAAEGALGQFAADAHDADPAGPLAAVDVRADGVALVVVDGRGLRYARWLPGGDDAEGLAAEVTQSLQHYALTAGAEPPARITCTGEPERRRRVAQCLEGAFDVAGFRLPQDVDWDVPQEQAAEHALSVGALCVLQRAENGHPPVAPPLAGPVARGTGRRRVPAAALLALNVLLGVALFWTVFAARSARLEAAERALEAARTLARDAAMLQEEVEVLTRESTTRRLMHDSLLEVLETLPQGIQPADVQFDGRGSLVVLGQTNSVGSAAEAAAALDALDWVERADLLRFSNANGKARFRIVCTLR